MQSNRTTTSESSENTNQHEESRWECNSFHCSWHRHFASMTSRLAPLLYDWGRGLSFTTDSFYPAIDNMAKHFGRNRKTVMAALEEMVQKGWAEVTHKEPGKRVRYLCSAIILSVSIHTAE